VKFNFVVYLICAAVNVPAQILNSGFENWTVIISDTVPDNWNMSNDGSGRSLDANSGSYAACVWNYNWFNKGWMVNGDVTGQNFSISNAYTGGTPISSKPLSLHGYYTYNFGLNTGQPDSAFVNVILKKYNTALQRPDTIALGRLFLSQSFSYIPFTVDIADFSVCNDPDSIVISFWSCYNTFCSCTTMSCCECLYFCIDDLSLQFPDRIIKIDEWFNGFSVYPNVISEKATVRIPRAPVENVQLSLYNSTGQSIQSWKENPGTETEFSRKNLESGFYFLQAKAGDTILGTRKLMIN